MPPGRRLPLPSSKLASHRARSPDSLQAGDKHEHRSLPHTQSLGQLAPPPYESPPPVPPRSPARGLPRGTPIAERLFNSGMEQDMSDPFRDDISASVSVYSTDEGVVNAEIAEDPTNQGSTNAFGKENSTQFMARIPRYPLRAQDRETLAQFLLFRGCLQQMGVTFSPDAELVTYGNPASKAEFEQMLRLGPLYEEKREQYFGPSNADSDRTTALWPDIRVLKRMLQNEGIRFDSMHNRLDHSGRDPKVDRLCTQYDGLLNKWIVQTRNVHPAFRRSLEDERVFESVPQNSRHEPTVPRNLGWSFIGSDNGRESVVVGGDNRCSSRLTYVTENSEPTEEQDAAQQPCEVQTSSESVDQDVHMAPTHLRSVPKSSPARRRPPPLTLYLPAPTPPLPHGSSPVQQDSWRRRHDHGGTPRVMATVGRRRVDEASVQEEQAIDRIREPRNRGNSKNVRRMRKWFKKSLGFGRQRKAT
ncbi:hypothetical protein E8E13_007663 [Curvularia kusanoi]|uniref:Uncharacterized protein n=1 Tax=Curvularia kusanoi TaxID=90978 RepID=A0A9P4TEP5_CURKU|nr:hypothetical protein E8E13_007663 [Curvularia kusanoi]